MVDANAYLSDRYRDLLAVAREYEAKSGRHDAAIDDALSSAFDYFWSHVGSTSRPRAVFFNCLKRERARALRFNRYERKNGCRALLWFH
jgi:hypothetical protein